MEILEKLFESEVLTEETKAALEEGISELVSEAVAEAVEKAKEETEIQVRTELSEKFVEDKNALVEALDTKSQRIIEEEFAELKDDIENFRDLEVEYNERLVEEKQKLAKVAKADFAKFVDIVSEFLEERLAAEFKEFEEEINEVRKLRFGENLYNAIKETFERDFYDSDEIHKEREKAKEELQEATKKLDEVKNQYAALERKTVLNEALSTLEGKPRELMAAILDRVETDKINETFEKYIGRVLNESVVNEEEQKENKKVLAESDNNPSEKVVTETVTVTGDTSGPEVITEGDEEKSGLSEEAKKRLRNLAFG